MSGAPRDSPGAFQSRLTAGARRARSQLRQMVGGRRPSSTDEALARLGEAHTTLRLLIGRGEVAELRLREDGSILQLVDGRKFWFDPTDRLQHMYTVSTQGQFEPKETKFVSGLVQPGWTCIDVGASFGWYATLLAQKVGPTGHVHAFEPIEPHADVLQANIELNEVADRVTVHRMALGDRDAEVELFIPDIGVSGSLRLHAYKSSWESHRATMTTLTGLVERLGDRRVDLIKADVEGAELAMLHGARQVLERDRPTLMLEVQEHSTRLFGYEPADVFSYLAGFGYSAHVVASDGSLATFDANDLPDHNFVFRA